ncbi:MAG: tetratricopeptide repeat protein, partial [Bradyrhizobiaceae bacterium]|nr:tetratricopeptide repeat protein [Bradyrhizobiaceae bacterium]
KFANAYNRRGLARGAQGDYDQAIADYDQAITLNANFAEAYMNRGFAWWKKGDLDRAIADDDQAIRLRPNLEAAYNNRGRVFTDRGDYDRAIADFGQAIGINPNFPNPYSHRGLAYAKKGDFDRAMADLDRAIVLDPKYAAGYSSRAAVYELRGDLDHAIADYDHALKLDPMLAEARHGRERVEIGQAAPPVSTKPSLLQVAESAVAAAVSAGRERRVALVIGNAEYRSTAVLQNPRRDAKAVADALRQTGFQTVELKMDLDRDAMVKALRAFRNQADGADWAMIYFAGYGMEINGVNYLIPIDARLVDDRDVNAETLSYEELLNAIGGAKTLRLLVLDACRANPFERSMRRATASSRGVDRGLAAPPEAEPGTLIVYAAKDGQVSADDADGANSPFARAFVTELKVPGLEVRRLFDYVRDDVMEATNRRQQPFTYGSLPGRRDFFFVSAK